jgi:phenylpyruvate tautomerase PptA (4-oxalocrotonate tautomerase family)
MPIMNLTYPEGALSEEAKEKLSEELTTALLRAERAPDTDFFRNITWLYIHELPEGNLRAAGVAVDKPTFRLDVTTPEGALPERRRPEMVEAATKVIQEAAGLGDEDLLRIWVLLHDQPEGQWGAGGQIIHFQQLVEAAKAEKEQEGEAEEALAPSA